MDKKEFSEVKDRVLEVNGVIAKLDPSIRITAFDFLKPYITGGRPTRSTDSKKEPPDEGPSADEAELIQKHGSGKPHENVNLLAAIWFGDYGSTPFSLDYIRQKASSTGLTIPQRLDMTLTESRIIE
jgi:hypothetical protein